ncbi:hypothetical protein HCDG_07216 [Histoplasma capsulatum H143]|uniref:Uncharacterized protein n=1 Tax=Ajellomyces capsulatus (strain H143) TaxID=544712 RepID=C6HMA0_AJECH|nr:hypothetical protein HCDG_07216 [Histoplasma capsulatum H143]
MSLPSSTTSNAAICAAAPRLAPNPDLPPHSPQEGYLRYIADAQPVRPPAFSVPQPANGRTRQRCQCKLSPGRKVWFWRRIEMLFFVHHFDTLAIEWLIEYLLIAIKASCVTRCQKGPPAFPESSIAQSPATERQSSHNRRTFAAWCPRPPPGDGVGMAWIPICRIATSFPIFPDLLHIGAYGLISPLHPHC